MKDRKTKTFIFEGLGFPIKLINAPMKKVFGEWYIDINMNKLMFVVFAALAHKPVPLTEDELGFIRSYLGLDFIRSTKKDHRYQPVVFAWEIDMRDEGLDLSH
jgi:hypothetical protein